MKSIFNQSLLVVLLLVSLPTLAGNEPEEMNEFITRLMSKMTIEEKIGQLNLLPGGDITTGERKEHPLIELIVNGKVGSFLNVKGQANIRQLQELAVKKAIAACREECPQAQVIIHTERVSQSNVLKAFYQKMASYSVDYDVIGLSYYSYYHGNLATLNNALNEMEQNFPDKKIMLVEVGYYHDWQPNNVAYNLSSTYPITGEGQKAFTQALIETVNQHAQVNGFFWWWMEANEYGLDWTTQRVTDQWYNAGLFDNQTGKAEPALYVLSDFLAEGAGIHSATHPDAIDSSAVYTIDGRRVEGDLYGMPRGIYIFNGKKILR